METWLAVAVVVAVCRTWREWSLGVVIASAILIGLRYAVGIAGPALVITLPITVGALSGAGFAAKRFIQARRARKGAALPRFDQPRFDRTEPITVTGTVMGISNDGGYSTKGKVMLRLIAFGTNLTLLGFAFWQGMKFDSDWWMSLVVAVPPFTALLYVFVTWNERGAGRLGRLLGIWFDVKEAELQKRAKISR